MDQPTTAAVARQVTLSSPSEEFVSCCTRPLLRVHTLRQPAHYRRYVGDLSPAGQPHGDGEIKYADGSSYQGQWVDGKPNGHGISHSEGQYGDVYEGCRVDGLRCGFGTLRCAGGEVYTGMFIADRYEGRGRRFSSDGGGFEGSFKAGIEHGRGREFLPGGILFDGTWSWGKRHGRGITHSADSTRHEAVYEHGAIVGVSRMFYPLIRPGSPGRWLQRFTGPPLSAIMRESDRPVRLKLQPVPAWLVADAPAAADSLSTDRQLQPLRVRSWFTLLSKPTPSAFCRGDSYAREDLHAPVGLATREVHVRVHLRAVQLTDHRSVWSCGANLQVAPLLEWDQHEHQGEVVEAIAQPARPSTTLSLGRRPFLSVSPLS